MEFNSEFKGLNPVLGRGISGALAGMSNSNRDGWSPQYAVSVPVYIISHKAIPLEVWTGPECSRRLRLPDFKTIGT